MKTFSLICLAVFLLASCGSTEVIKQSKETSKVVAVEKKVIVRDTVFVTDTVKLVQKLAIKDLEAKKEPFKPIIKKRKNARVIIKKVYDTLHVEIQCDSIELAAKIKDMFVKELKQEVKVEVKEVPMKYTPRLTKWLAWIGSLSLGVLGVFGASKIYKFKIPF